MHGFIPADRFFPYLTWTDIESMPQKERVVLIQPVGAIEQHGPHLPIAVDSAIGLAVLGRALEQLDASIPAYAMPSLYYGKSNEHWHFPGTITLTAQTLTNMLMEVGESIYRAGFRKWILMNSHGGQPQIMDIVARDLHQRHDDFEVFPFFTWRVPHITKSLLTEKEAQLGIHAGDAETSLLLAILPETVKMDRAVTEYPQGLPTDSLLTLERNLPIPWLTRDISTSGVIGDAKAATKEKGEQIWQSVSAGWTQVISDVYRFEQPQQWRKS
ncbi:creatininase family protein [filamentous cyanobacterium LEGE 11480]|uniref:Creatininase family protein n=2 Tax=Romeriopsis TaxID=2992131 RepID=A0A928Z329_9CYAN|nr:creatininase family protein [Romeriopsis navalis LEGE 11480]